MPELIFSGKCWNSRAEPLEHPQKFLFLGDLWRRKCIKSNRYQSELSWWLQAGASAAGASVEGPKQYRRIGGRPVIAYTLEIFATWPQTTEIVAADSRR